MTLLDIDTYKPKSQMSAGLIKDSEELRVLALLYYADYDRYKNLTHQEKPDLQTADKKIGVEVTSAVDSNERKASGVFEAYKHGKTKRIKSVSDLAAKISEYGSSYLLVDSKKAIAGVGSLGTGEKLQANLANAIESKVKKAKGYKQFIELDATTRIEAEGLSWYSRFEMDTTVIPGISRRVKDNKTGQEVYRLIYWRAGYYEFAADQPQGKWTMFAEHRGGSYLFGTQGQPVTAMTERIDSAEWMPVSSMTVEPYFRTMFYEKASLALKMLVLSFPAMRFY